MHIEPTPTTGAEGLRVGIVVSRYHEAITTALKRGAIELFGRAGGSEDQLVTVSVPGTFELPVLCRHLARREDIDAVVALGCIVAGETRHDQHIADAVAAGLTALAIETGKPVTFGILTVQSVAQAKARAGGEKGNKGAEAMAAAIETVNAIRSLRGVKDHA